MQKALAAVFTAFIALIIVAYIILTSVYRILRTEQCEKENPYADVEYVYKDDVTDGYCKILSCKLEVVEKIETQPFPSMFGEYLVTYNNHSVKTNSLKPGCYEIHNGQCGLYIGEKCQ